MDAVADGYPTAWEADVLLSDGHPVHLRPITPADADALRAFHARLSPRTVYLRFFSAKPRLTDADVEYFTHVDHRSRVALVAWEQDDIIGVGRFDAIGDGRAEVAFIIRDDRQGLGLGSVLLEHLAAAAREVDVTRFVAEVLPENTRMLATFREAGFEVRQRHEEDVLAVSFDIEPTAASVAVTAAREHRAEARSMARVLTPSSVAVVGASRNPGGLGHAILRHLAQAGFTGDLVAVHREVDRIEGVACVRSLADAPVPIDLAVVVVPAGEVPSVVEDAAAAGVHALIVVSGGFGDAGADGLRRQAELVATVHRTGMRLVGPNALGVVNTAIGLNASLVPALPRQGRLGFFCQSGALGISILQRLGARGMGVSTFVSAGNRADVSGNDLLQYWEEDAATGAVLLHLETIGNARKFARLVRRISRTKPIVMVRAGGAAAQHPLGHATAASHLPQSAVDEILADCGLVVVDSVDRLLDAGRVLLDRPLPQQPSVAVVGNSDALAVLAMNALARAGLVPAGSPRTFPRGADATEYAAAVRDLAHDPSVGAVLAIHVPPIEADSDAGIRAVLGSCRDCGDEPHAPVVAVMAGSGIDHDDVPVFADVEDAVAALALAHAVAAWRVEDACRSAEEPAEWPAPTREPDGPGEWSGEDALGWIREATGWAPQLDLDSAGELGVVIRLVDDPSFGPVVSVGVDDPVADALGDRSHRLAPVTLRGAEAMLRDLGALAVVTGSPDGQVAEDERIAGLARAVHAISHLHLRLPGLVEAEVRRVRGMSVADARIEMGDRVGEVEPAARRL